MAKSSWVISWKCQNQNQVSRILNTQQNRVRDSLCSVYSFKKRCVSRVINGASVQKVNLQCILATETPELLDLDRKNFKGHVLFLTLFTALRVGQFSKTPFRASFLCHLTAVSIYPSAFCLLKVVLPLKQRWNSHQSKVRGEHRAENTVLQRAPRKQV